MLAQAAAALLRRMELAPWQPPEGSANGTANGTAASKAARALGQN